MSDGFTLLLMNERKIYTFIKKWAEDLHLLKKWAEDLRNWAKNLRGPFFWADILPN